VKPGVGDGCAVNVAVTDERIVLVEVVAVLGVSGVKVWVARGCGLEEQPTRLSIIMQNRVKKRYNREVSIA
jgi:hypothetical protein